MAADPETDEFEVLHTPVIATIGAFALIGAGLFTAASGMQLLTVITVYPLWAKMMPWMMLVSGVFSLVVGGALSGGRFWAALVSVPLAGFMTFISGIWTVWALMSGFFSLLPVLAGFISFGALVIVPFSIPGTKRITAARARLFE